MQMNAGAIKHRTNWRIHTLETYLLLSFHSYIASSRALTCFSTVKYPEHYIYFEIFENKLKGFLLNMGFLVLSITDLQSSGWGN